jgi:hypothetical protein
MGLRELLIPQDKVFFDLFEKQAGVVKEAAWQLVALTEDFTNVKEKRHEIEKLEHKGDQLTHDIYDQLNRTFITPLDPGYPGKHDPYHLHFHHGRRDNHGGEYSEMGCCPEDHVGLDPDHPDLCPDWLCGICHNPHNHQVLNSGAMDRIGR